MAFRYINPGYVSLLNADCTATEYSGTTYSKTGTGFSQTESTAGITVAQFSAGDDFWARFDAYIPLNQDAYIYLYFPNSDRSGVRIYCRANETNWGEILQYHNATTRNVASGTNKTLGINTNEINSFLVYAKLGDTATAKLRLWINGKEFSASNAGMTYSESYSKVAVLYSTCQDIIFSNIIFSDEEISLKERTTKAFPISSTATDMTTGENGIYIADAANQTLLQTIDVSTLIENYGASSAVTGIAVVGNPAYKTATGLASMIGITKSGDASIVEHGSCDLSDDTEAVISAGWATDNLTIADLQNMQFGWKAGE